MQCQDEVKDKVTPSTSDADIDKYRLEFEQCAIACCDKNIGKLGPLTRRVKETLMSGKYWFSETVSAVEIVCKSDRTT